MKTSYLLTLTTLLCTYLLISSCDSCRVVNQPQWIEQGPYYLKDTSTEGIPDEPAIGAINAILPHPENKEILYIGSVNGGVWKTENAWDRHPHWEPLTDHMPSLSISDLVFDPLDDSWQTIYASTGNLSSGGWKGGPHVGLYVTSDGGESWSQLGDSTLRNKRIFRILALPANAADPKQPNLFVATDDGVYMSSDGINFSQSLSDNVRDLVSDPDDPTRLFAAVPGGGVFTTVTTTTPLAWSPLPIPNWKPSDSRNIQLHHISKQLYIAIARSGNSRVMLFRGPPPYDKFVQLNDPTTIEGAIAFVGGKKYGPWPGDQQNTHFSFFVREMPDGPHIFLGGDRNMKQSTLLFSSTGQGKYSGRIFRGTFKDGNSNWLPMVGAATKGTAPHADSRRFAVDATGVLLEANDGGLFRLNGKENNWHWESVNGDLRITEMYSVAWDPHTNSIVAGTQDNGSIEQVTPAIAGDTDKVWKAARLFSYMDVDLAGLVAQSSNLESDGGIVDVALKDDHSIRYGMGNNLAVFVSRRYFNTIDPYNVAATFHNFRPDIHPADTMNYEGFTLVRYMVNQDDPSRLVIGGRATYELTGDVLTITTIDTARLTRNASSVAYGAPGQRGMLYVAKTNEISQRVFTDGPWVRRQFVDTTLATQPGIRDIVMDPDDPNDLYFITRRQVYRWNNFSDNTNSIDTLTGNLQAGVDGFSADLQTLTVFNVNIKGDNRKVILTGGYSGVHYLLNPEPGPGQPIWIKYGLGLPNIIVRDLDYNADDDVLVAGTWGRGAWLIRDVSLNIPEIIIDDITP